MATKAVAIRYRWPLLTPTQDPDGVPARFAYHLRRLGLTTTALKMLLPPRHHRLLNDYVAGRAPVVAKDVLAIASQLQLPPDDLLRPLTADEDRAWDFYRVSAANRSVVWGRASAAWSTLAINQREVADLMGLSATVVSSAALGRTKHILDYPPAARLAEACKLPDGAHSLIAGLSLDGRPPR